MQTYDYKIVKFEERKREKEDESTREMQIIAHEEKERTPSPDSRLEVRLADWDEALDHFKCVGCRRDFNS